MKTNWLKPEDDLKKVTVQELERSLLTTDGRGVEFKNKVLEELKQRWLLERACENASP